MNERLGWIDVARGVGIILVVAGHSVDPAGESAKLIFSFHMPFFFLLAGFLFNFAGYRNAPARLIANRWKRLMLPYLGVMTLYTLWSLWVFGHPAFPPGREPRQILIESALSAAYGTGNVVAQFPKLVPVGPVWFLPALFAATLIFWSCLRVSDTWHTTARIALILTVSTAGMFLGRSFVMPWSIDLALASQVFMYAGYELRQHGVLERMRTVVLVPALAAVWYGCTRISFISMNNRAYDQWLVACVGAIAGSVLVLVVSRLIDRVPVLNGAMRFIGTETIPIMAIHARPDMPWLSDSLVQYLQGTLPGLIVMRVFYGLVAGWIVRHIAVLRSLFYWDKFPLWVKRESRGVPQAAR